MRDYGSDCVSIAVMRPVCSLPADIDLPLLCV